MLDRTRVPASCRLDGDDATTEPTVILRRRIFLKVLRAADVGCRAISALYALTACVREMAAASQVGVLAGESLASSCFGFGGSVDAGVMAAIDGL